jgi:hypothetical protein
MVRSPMYGLHMRHTLTSHLDTLGLNYDNEWSEMNANRHVQMVEAMLTDGM